MNLIPIGEVSMQINCGAPLPWNVRDADGKLLLAQGYLIQTMAMLHSLLRRGVFVDAEEVRESQELSPALFLGPGKPVVPFAEQWQAVEERLTGLLQNYRDPKFLSGICDVESMISTATEKHTDQMIYSVIRHDQSSFDSYGITHSIHVASVCSILANRLRWSKRQKAAVINAALTMNLSIIKLQGELARTDGAISQDQRSRIHAHPAESVRILKEAGLTDADWLTGVEQHHESPNGSGYPYGAKDNLSEISQMIRFADIFTAKYSARKGRVPMPAKQAAKSVYLASDGHPIASALLKEFGVYPPGCVVMLESGETAVTIRRGKTAIAPLVAVLRDKNGMRITDPLVRETALPRYAILRTIPNGAVPFETSMERLFTLTAE
jgi:HD-GYP domain-containing protein (c-di-GMP phosphodiesterase class II)